MAKNNNLTDFVRDLADGFREKLGWETTDKINPQDFRDFIDHSPSVGSLTYGLETLNWTKTLTFEDCITIDCPSNIDISMYYNVDTGTQLLPLIQFRFVALDPIAVPDNVFIEDDMTKAWIGTLSANKTEIRYILPVFADEGNESLSPTFPPFSVYPVLMEAESVRVQMTASWVQIGSTQYPMRLSGATMGGVK